MGAFLPAARVPSRCRVDEPTEYESVWAFVVLFVIVQTVLEAVQVVKAFGWTVNLVGFHVAGAFWILTLGSVVVATPAIPDLADPTVEAEAGDIKPIRPATLRTAIVDATPSRLLSENIVISPSK